MSKRMLLMLALASAASPSLVCADDKAASEESVLKDQKAKDSYAVGMQMGGKLKGASLDLDAELVARGVKDAMTGATTLLSEAEMSASLNTLRADFRAKQVEVLKGVAEKNKKDGEAFLVDNKTKEGVVTLESGLQYKVLKAGDGKKPSQADTVVCHYRGTLIDGTEFDSSYKRNQPASLPLKSVIAGWREALQLMPVGSKWQLFIPSGLAYGESGQRGRGRRNTIGPNTALVFEVELLSIQDSAAKPAQAPAAKPGEAAAANAEIRVSFKLDPRITKASYMGDRWVSPPTYTTTLDTVEARVASVDTKGGLRDVSASWIPSDPQMVTISPNEGSEVKINVKRAGESSVQVSSDGASRELAIKAVNKGPALQVEIAARQ
jgi:FKBP-type peptidyl-prolyl cis-trans isomerase